MSTVSDIRAKSSRVKKGYARNYLIPKQMAVVTTKGIERQAESMQRAREVKEARDREAASEVGWQAF